MVQSEDLLKQLLETIETLNQASIQLYEMISSENKTCNQFIALMMEMLTKMQPLLQQLSTEEPALKAHLMCKNATSSLGNIAVLKDLSSQNACQKIEFELLPLTNELYVDLYFWGLCYPDEKKMWNYYRTEMPEMCPLPAPPINGAYPYEISIVVVAYNKLEYTKECIKSIEKYFPQSISHELILINNGSNDGTREYFESLHPDKQIDICCNTKSFSVASRVVEGRYTLFVSNDVIITPDAVKNMLTCIQSDESIGFVVPVCPNIANLQPIPANYSTIEEMISFAKKNNKCDPFRWEQRARLCSPAVLARSDSAALHSFMGYLYPFYPERFLAFTDDLMSLVARRNGLKCILAKDAYVHHFGSVTIREAAQKQRTLYADGCREFERSFGINPWGTGFCFDPLLMQTLSPQDSGPVNILGINCGMGDNPLKIKGILRETQKNQTVYIYNLSDQVKYKKDLESVSDHFLLVQKWSQINKFFPDITFSYIIVEDIDVQESAVKMIGKLFARLTLGGKMAIKSTQESLKNSLLGIYNKLEQINSWIILKKS